MSVVLVEVDVEGHGDELMHGAAMRGLMTWRTAPPVRGVCAIRLRGPADVVENVLRGWWNPTMTTADFEALILEVQRY